MLGPLLKIRARIDSLDRLTKGKYYPAKVKGAIVEYVLDNGRTAKMEIYKVERYFHLCDCGSWSDGHSPWCAYYGGKENA